MSDLATVNVAVSPIEKFEEFLRTKGMRLTQERLLIVQKVFADHEHFDVDQLVGVLEHRKERRVSRSSVYRTINLLEEAGLLRKVARTDARDVYEHDYGYPQHDHLICKQCGSLTEFTNDAISRTLEDVAAEHGFRMEGHRMEVYGLCEKCSQPPRRRHPMLDRI